MNKELRIPVQGQGLYDVTAQVVAAIKEAGVADGLATLFIQHTSASLLIQENADPAVQVDLQNWLNRLVPETMRSIPMWKRARMTCLRILKVR